MNAQTQPQASDNSILFPVGRIVQGDLYEPQTKDMQGNPLTIKTGEKKGQPTIRYFFAVAIPKTPGAQHWAQESWGAKIWQKGHEWWPSLIDQRTGMIAHPKFAWKIDDGDDATPNFQAGGRRNCDREGFPGCWVVSFTSSFATKVFDEQGQPLLQPGLVKRGYYVEVWGNIASNENPQNPGIYMNHGMVAYRAPGKEIVSGPDPRAVGFGRSALPAGVTAAPAGNTAVMPSPMGSPVPGVPSPGAPAAAAPAPFPGAPAPMAPATPAAPTPTAVAPHPGFLSPPVAGAVAPAVPAAPVVAAPPLPPPAAAPSMVDPLGAPTGFKMANPNGANYATMVAAGWTNDLLMQHGHMVRL